MKNRFFCFFTLNALVATGGMAPKLIWAADIGWSAELASSLHHQNNVALSSASPINSDSAELRMNMNFWNKTETQSSGVELAFKDDQYTKNAEFEQDVRSVSIEHSIKRELTQYSLQAEVSRSTTLGDSYSSGEYIRRNVPVVSRSVSASVGQNFSESIYATLTANLTETRYSHEEEIGNQDYNDRQFSGNFRYQDSERADWQISPYVDYMDQLQSGLQVTTSGLTLLRTYKIIELWDLSGKYGRRKTQFDGRNIFGEYFSQDNFGRVSSVDLKRKGQLSSIGIGASEDLSPRANGVLDETQRIGAWWQLSISERMNMKINMSRIKRKPISGAFFIDDTTQSDTVSAALGYGWSERLSLDAQVRLTKRENNFNGGHTVADGNMISLGLRWQLHP